MLRGSIERNRESRMALMVWHKEERRLKEKKRTRGGKKWSQRGTGSLRMAKQVCDKDGKRKKEDGWW